MKKRSLFKRFYLYVKRLNYRFGMWKDSYYNLHVDLGKKR